VRQLVLQFALLYVDVALAFLGGVVFRVLREVAVGARLFDVLDVLGTPTFIRWSRSFLSLS
jgi:hypothetical protein